MLYCTVVYVILIQVESVYENCILPTMSEYETEDSDNEDTTEEDLDNFAKPLNSYLEYFEATWI